MSFAQKTIDSLEQGNITQAHDYFERALNHESGELVFNMAQTCADLGFNDWAQTALRKLLRQFPEEDQLRVRLAELLVADGKDDDALLLLDEVAPTSPAYVDSLLASADLYQTQGLPEVSEQKLLEAHRLAPDEPIIVFGLAELAFYQKNYHAAKDWYLQLVKQGHLDMAQVNLVARLGISYAALGQFDHALAYLEQIAPDQLDDDGLFQLGFTQLQLKHYDDAIKNLQRLRDQTPSYATLYQPLATALEQQGRLNDALKTAQEGLSHTKYDDNLLLKASQLALKAGQLDVAEKYLTQAHANHPDNLTVLTQLAQVLVTTKKYTEALHLINQAGQTVVADPEIAWLLGQCYWHENDFAQAQGNYDVAAQSLTGVDFVSDAVRFYREAGNLTGAQQLLERGLAAHPNSAELLDLQASLE